MPVGLPEMDAVLSWGGLARGCLHEVAGRRHGDGIPDGAAVAFSAFLLGRLAAQAGKPVLWIGGDGEDYAPGLAALGLPPSLRILSVERLAQVFERFRQLVLTGRCLKVEGKVQKEGLVIYVIADKLTDLTPALRSLGVGDMNLRSRDFH